MAEQGLRILLDQNVPVAVADWLRRLLSKVPENDCRGALIVVDNQKIRIRKS